MRSNQLSVSIVFAYWLANKTLLRSNGVGFNALFVGSGANR